MSIAVCGVACDVCRKYMSEECPGCDCGTSKAAKDFLEKQKEWENICPVLECAISKGVDYCLKDCSQMPCDNLYKGMPYSKDFLDTFRG